MEARGTGVGSFFIDGSHIADSWFSNGLILRLHQYWVNSVGEGLPEVTDID